MDQTSHVLVHCEKDSKGPTKCSGILFRDEYILTTAKIIGDSIGVCENVRKTLMDFRPIKTDKIFDGLKFSIVQKRSQESNELIKRDAFLILIFNVEKIFKEFQRLSKVFILGNSGDLLNSTFIILSLNKTQNWNAESLIKTFNIHSMGESSLVGQIRIKPKKINRFDEVASISTPFGHESFFGTTSFGRISNLLGENDAVGVVTIPLVPEIEGSGIYSFSGGDLIGILICLELRSYKDNFDITLMGNFNEILMDLIKQIDVSVVLVKNEELRNVLGIPETISSKSSVLIQGIGLFGSGNFIKIRGKKFIITCAHVVRNVSLDS